MTSKTRKSTSNITPRSKKRLKHYKNMINSLKCKLFRERKRKSCFYNFSNRTLIGRTQVTRKINALIAESKAFLSKEAHALFSFQLRYAVKTKYSRRYDDCMKQMCLTWYYSSPKGYNALRKSLNLPTPRTLRTWQSALQVDTGINRMVLQSITNHFATVKNSHEKICSIIFDEISLKEELFYDSSKDKIIGVTDNGEERKNTPANSALVCMVRGVTSNWKHVIGFWFLGNSDTSANIYTIIMQCITSLYDAGAIVKLLVCDQGPCNRSLAKKFLIDEKKTYFKFQDTKIYFVYDVPHLLKSLRNNLLKYDLLYKGQIVSWKHILSVFLAQNPITLRMLPKITPQHININNFNAMRVKYAAQVFSDTMSVALLVAKHFQIVGPESEHTSKFVKDIDNLFDTLNSNRFKEDKIKLRYAMSKDSPHEKLLTDIKNNLQNSQFIGSNKPACLKGWVISISSILHLAKDLRDNYGVEKLLTRHLNQDPLENFFAIVRQQHGNVKNPNPYQFQNGLRHTYISTISKLSENSNCEDDNTVTLTKLTELLHKKIIEPINEEHLDSDVQDQIEKLKDLPDIMDGIRTKTDIDRNGIYYVAGYYCKKFLKIHKCAECEKIIFDNDKLLIGDHQLFTFFKQCDTLKNNQGLKFVTNEVFDVIQSLEAIHNSLFNKFLKSRSLTKDLLFIVQNKYNVKIKLCSEESSILFLKLFLKIRNFWAVRFFNKNKFSKVKNKKIQKLRNIMHE